MSAIAGAFVSTGLLALCSAGAASGAERGFYVTGFYGEAKRQTDDVSSLDELANSLYDFYGFTPDSSVSSLSDDTDAAYGMAGGYRLLPNLAFEAGYVNLGALSYHNDSVGVSQGEQQAWAQKISVRSSGFTLAALAVLPLSYRWELYGRAGVLFAKNEIDLHITDFENSDTLRGAQSSTEWLAGVGASFSFAEVYSARFEYQRVFNAGKDLAEGDLDVMSIGIAVSF